MDFQPIASSSLSKAHLNGDTVASIAAEVARTAPIAEFEDLTHQDVKIIDAVIQRAAPSATTFLAIFKAYNDILLEHGLDPHEVTYYGKLLKLGTLRGQTWGDKWAMVKRHYGFEDRGQPSDINLTQPTYPLRPTLSTLASVDARDDDVFTTYSRNEEHTEYLASEADTSIDRNHYHVLPRPPSTIPTNSLGLDIDSTHRTQAIQSRFSSKPPLRRRGPDTWVSASSEDGRTAPTLPSYGAAVRDMGSLAPPRPPTKRDALLASPAFTASAARRAVAKARESKGSVINEDQAWNNIRMAQDEKEADRFRNERLVERCWDIWRQGLQWVHTTSEQMGQARDCHIIRLSLHHWRNLVHSRTELYQRVTQLDTERRLRRSLNCWVRKLQESRQANWQHAMRAKMKIVRDKRDSKLRKDAWAKWRQSYQSHLSQQHHSERLIIRSYRKWKDRLFGLDRMDTAADNRASVMEKKFLERAWNTWRRGMEMKLMEKAISERVCVRLMGEAMSVWKRCLHSHRMADMCYEMFLQKRVMKSWKTSRDRIRSMNKRALKHLARQDVVLLTAVARVWKARERARLLERVRAGRLVKNVWTAWTRRMRSRKRHEEIAISFSCRLDSSFKFAAFRRWHEIYVTHCNAQRFAVQYHASRLQFRLLLTWRIQLRLNMKSAKEARAANRFFTTRRGWKKIVAAFEARKREKKIQAFEKRQVVRHFRVWQQRSRRQIQHKSAEQKLQSRVDQRTAQAALTKWTNRVIQIKLRELDIAQRNETQTVELAFKKWKSVCMRHIEELNLMESYQFVKREENLRRTFHRWLSAARASRHQRVTLQQKEAELQHSWLVAAWDKWRERYLHEKLRPLEFEVVAQTQTNQLFRIFGIWHSKTRSLPAIRFHASHIKKRYWLLWRNTMPRALQAKRARDMHRQSVLNKALDRWSQTYRTKIALKAVARARYLRLPTTVPRPVAQSRPTYAGDAAMSETEDDPRPRPSRSPSSLGLFPPRLTLANRPRSEGGFAHPAFADGTRESSATRLNENLGWPKRIRGVETTSGSRLGGDDLAQNKLWQELKQVRGRSRPPTTGSRSPSRGRP